MADLTEGDLKRIKAIGHDDPLAGMHAGLIAVMAAKTEPFPGVKFETENEELRITRAAIAWAHWVWRSPIENWHASGEGLVDSEMMRENSAVVKLIRRMVVNGASWRETRKAVLNPKRRLVDGRTVKEALGDWKPEVNRSSVDRAYMYDAYEERYGRTETLWLLAMSHMGFGHDWHGMPEWEEIVDCFCIAVDDMSVEFWDLSKARKRKGEWPLPPRPLARRTRGAAGRDRPDPRRVRATALGQGAR